MPDPSPSYKNPLSRVYSPIINTPKANNPEENKNWVNNEKTTPGRNTNIDAYLIDYRKLAKTVDPIVGRETEIYDITQKLMNKDRPNVALTGDSGVGKTALATGIAQQINEGNVPDFLKDREVIGLNLDAFKAGTNLHGDLNERLICVTDYLKERKDKVIFFIDEFHRLAESHDKAKQDLGLIDDLKEFFATSGVPCIVATTSEEYEQYIASHAPARRRFNQLEVNELDLRSTLALLMALKKKYEERHNVTMSDKAIEAAVTLSENLPGTWPGKALALLDEAGSSINMERYQPRAIVELESRLEKAKRVYALYNKSKEGKELEREIDELERQLLYLTEQYEEGISGQVTAEIIAKIASPKLHQSVNTIKENNKKLFSSEEQEIIDDEEVLLKRLETDGLALQYASERLKNNRTLVLKALKQNGRALQYASKSFQNNSQIARVALTQDGTALEFVSERLRYDYEVIRTAVNQNGSAVRYAYWRNYQEVVYDQGTNSSSEKVDTEKPSGRKRDAIKRWLKEPWVDKANSLFDGKGLINDPQIALEMVTQNGLMLQYVSHELRKDPVIVGAALEQNGWALQYANDLLKNDFKMVFKAVTSNGWALRFASSKLKEDRIIVRAALAQNPEALQSIANSHDFLEDLMRPFKGQKYALDYLRNDPEMLRVFKLARDNVTIEKHRQLVPPIDKHSSREAVLAAVRIDGLALKDAGKFQKDAQIVRAALAQNGLALQYVNPSLRKEKEIILAALEQTGFALQYVDENIQNRHMEEIILKAVEKGGWAVLHFASKKVRSNKELLAKVESRLKYYPPQHATENLSERFSIFCAAVTQDGSAVKYIDKKFRHNLMIIALAIRQGNLSRENAFNFLKPRYNPALLAHIDYSDKLLSALLLLAPLEEKVMYEKDDAKKNALQEMIHDIEEAILAFSSDNDDEKLRYSLLEAKENVRDVLDEQEEQLIDYALDEILDSFSERPEFAEVGNLVRYTYARRR